MRRWFVPPQILFAALVVFSCTASRDTGLPRPLPFDEIVRRMKERVLSIRSMEADGTLTIESPVNSGSASFELQAKLPDSLWMRFTGPFGISLGTLMLSRERFVFYDAQENRRLVGTPNAGNLERMFNVALSFEEIIDAVVGSFGMIDTADASRGVSIHENQYVLQTPTAFGRKELWVDPATFVTTRSAAFGRDGRPLVTGSASRLETINGANIPHLIRIVLPKQRESATIAYRNVSVNTKPQKTFVLPHDAAETDLDHAR